MPFRLTRTVKALLISCFVVFLIQHTAEQFFDFGFVGWFGLVPYSFVIGHRFWQLFTYVFLHADVMHLFLNLMMLAFIGGELEAAWGARRFISYFFFCTTFAGIVYLGFQLFHGSGLYVPMIGASAGIYGLLVAYGILYSERMLLFMMLFPIKAKHFVWILSAIEFMSSVFSGREGLSGVAHLAGMAGGFIYLTGLTKFSAARRRSRFGKGGRFSFFERKKSKKTSDHLRLVIDNDKDFEHDDHSDEPKTWN